MKLTISIITLSLALLASTTEPARAQSALDTLESLAGNCFSKAAPGVVAISIEPRTAQDGAGEAAAIDDPSAMLDLQHVGDELFEEILKRIKGGSAPAEDDSPGLTREDVRESVYRHVESSTGIGLVAQDMDLPDTAPSSSGNGEDADHGTASESAEASQTGLPPGVAQGTVSSGPNPRRGTGFIIGEDGTIVTIGDLFEGFGPDSKIVITYTSGRSSGAVLRGIDSHTNIAVLRADILEGNALPLGDSRALKVGKTLVSVSCPYGLPPSAYVGFVSGLGRKIGPSEKAGTRYERYIQTDLPLHPGSHGGPVLDRSERVVGMLAATVRQGDWSEVTFAIPTEILKPVVEEIIKRGSVAYGYLGVSLAAEQLGVDDLFKEPGVIVSEVKPDSPAALAKLSPGDRILRIGDVETNSSDDLVWSIFLHRPGDPVSLSIFREGRQLTIPVVLTDRETGKN